MPTAAGFKIPEHVAAQAGVSLPSAEDVQASVNKVLKELADSQAASGEDGKEWEGKEEGEEEDKEEEDVGAPPTSSVQASRQGGLPAAAAGVGSKKVWGAGWARRGAPSLPTASPAVATSPPLSQMSDKAPAMPAAPVTMSMAQLRLAAKRRGVDVQLLVEDARTKGVTVGDD